MLERLRKLLGSDKREGDTAGISYPLCRLRHATLHPGASLWTPGSAGGHLGAGASAALDEVGVGGEVVVAFQTRAREPVHPRGVIARVEAVEPFPEDWDPEGLGATRRYKLLGLRRVVLDVESFTHRRVPTAAVSDGGDLPEDWAAPPDALITQLRDLSSTDSSWPPHWQEAFTTLPTAALGQWATTLGWRLGPDERLALFDNPQRIVEVVRGTLDSLQLGLDPLRRRAAVRRQTITRRTSAMPERQLRVVTDEEGWALFHPADFAASEDDAESGALGREARMAAHLARGDGVMILSDPFVPVAVRVTANPLTPDEQAQRTGEASFKLDVRHGRLFLGRGGLTTGNHFDDRLDYTDAAQWIDVPLGLFKVSVSALAPVADDEPDPAEGVDHDRSGSEPVASAEPQAEASGEPAPSPPAEPPAPLKRYIVRFEAIDSLDEVPTLEARPRL